jgi:hypothetical protein
VQNFNESNKRLKKTWLRRIFRQRRKNHPVCASRSLPLLQKEGIFVTNLVDLVETLSELD